MIIGGVAGGMSAATRLRRLDEHASIVVLERSGHVSYANCGLHTSSAGDRGRGGPPLADAGAALRALPARCPRKHRSRGYRPVRAHGHGPPVDGGSSGGAAL